MQQKPNVNLPERHFFYESLHRDRKFAQESADDRVSPVELIFDLDFQHVNGGHCEGELLQVKGQEKQCKLYMYM